MFEALTSLLPALQGKDELGQWIVDRENDGTLEHPIQVPFVNYSQSVLDFEKALYGIVDTHPELELTKYAEILSRHGINWDMSEMASAEVSGLDGQCVMALLVGAVRADRFSEGTLLEFFHNGCIQKWLVRLKQLDEETK